MSILARCNSWPVDLDTLRDEVRLELLAPLLRVADGARTELLLDAECRQGTRGLANGPLDGVQTVEAVGDMGHAQVLAGWKEVLDALGNERTERNLEWQRAHVNVVVSSATGMQVDPV